MLAEARAHAEEVVSAMHCILVICLNDVVLIEPSSHLQYKAQYLEMYGSDGQTPAPSRPAYSGASHKVKPLLCKLPDSDSDDNEPESEPEPDASAVAKPWLKDFNGYLDSTDNLGELSIVQWWGVRIFSYSL